MTGKNEMWEKVIFKGRNYFDVKELFSTSKNTNSQETSI